MTRILEYFDTFLVPFGYNGYAKLVRFKGHARRVLKIAQIDLTDDILENFSKTIQAEWEVTETDTDTYKCAIDL